MRRPNFVIALRFLLAKRRAMLMSLVGIVFGVAFFILTQAQTSGFQGFFVETILGTNGAIRVQDRFQSTVTSMIASADSDGTQVEIALREGQRYIPGIQQPQSVLEALRGFETVTAATPVLRGNATLRSGFRTERGRIHGIELNSYVEVTELRSQVTAADLAEFERTSDGILIGSELARRLSIQAGDPVFIDAGGLNQVRYRVCGIFTTGIVQIDRYHFYAHMRSVRSVLGEWDDVTYVQALIRDPERATIVARHLEETLGHSVASWQERERSWLEVFRALRFSSAISMSSIILIAGLGMFNTLAIIVMERAREIAILRSIGYTRGDIARIFLYQGFIIYVFGWLLGCLTGAGLTALIESLPIRIRGIFSTDHFIMHWAWSHYVWAGVVTALVVFTASLLPARRAAQIEPGVVIRGASG
jgi:lipoprotein-releasing system permease protein|tara:strand:- start:123 stop:1379 length:1257 start_codon:yes stop_codon:yes gene_type:complete